MGNDQAKGPTAKASSKGLMKNAAKEERKVEAQTGKELPKGAKRVIERSNSADGKDPGAKQR